VEVHAVVACVTISGIMHAEEATTGLGLAAFEPHLLRQQADKLLHVVGALQASSQRVKVVAVLGIACNEGDLLVCLLVCVCFLPISCKATAARNERKKKQRSPLVGCQCVNTRET
jgi:hypothetical protein